MKTNKLFKRSIAMVLVFTLFIFTAMTQTTAAPRIDDSFSYITFDTIGVKAKNINKEFKTNGIFLGEENGIQLEENTEYSYSFKLRMEDRLSNEEKTGEYDDTENSYRLPVFQVLRDGTDSTTTAMGLTGANLSGAGHLKPYEIPLNEWKTYTGTFKTDEKFNGNKYFLFVTYGDIKFSIGEFVLTANGKSTTYSFENLKNLPTSGQSRPTAKLYTGTPTDETHEYPTLKVTTTAVHTVLTLDATVATLATPSNNSSHINGLKLTTQHGLSLEANETYTVSFDYRLDDIKRPSDDLPLNAGIYNCRTPIIQVYKDGLHPTNAFPSDADTEIGGGIVTRAGGVVNPWSLTVGKWYTFSFTYTTIEELSGNTVFALVTYGAMKGSYKNLKVTDSSGNTNTYQLGKVFDNILMQNDVYDINNESGIYPNINISTERFAELGDVDGDGTTGLLDLLRLKKYLANNEAEINLGADCDLEIGIMSGDLVALRRIILNY